MLRALLGRRPSQAELEADRDRRLGLVEVESNHDYFRRLDLLEESRRPLKPVIKKKASEQMVVTPEVKFAVPEVEDSPAMEVEEPELPVEQSLPPTAVPEDSTAEEEPAAEEPRSDASTGPLAVGDWVQAWHHGGADWYPAVLVEIRSNTDTGKVEYGVKFDGVEGDEAYEFRKPPEEVVRSPPEASAHEDGAEVREEQSATSTAPKSEKRVMFQEDSVEGVEETEVADEVAQQAEFPSDGGENDQVALAEQKPSIADSTTVTTNSVESGVVYRSEDVPETPAEKKRRMQQQRELAAKEEKERKLKEKADKVAKAAEDRLAAKHAKEQKLKEKKDKATKAKEDKERAKREKAEKAQAEKLRKKEEKEVRPSKHLATLVGFLAF